VFKVVSVCFKRATKQSFVSRIQGGASSGKYSHLHADECSTSSFHYRSERERERERKRKCVHQVGTIGTREDCFVYVLQVRKIGKDCLGSILHYR